MIYCMFQRLLVLNVTRLTNLETYKWQQMTCQNNSPQTRCGPNFSGRLLDDHKFGLKKTCSNKNDSCSCRAEEMFVSSDPGEKSERQRKQVVIIQCEYRKQRDSRLVFHHEKLKRSSRTCGAEEKRSVIN